MKTKDFISKFNDVEVIQKMQSVKAPEEAYAVAKEYGVTDSLEEFVEEMTKFKTAIDELSDEDLEAVAGGLSQLEAISASVVSTVTIASVSATVDSVISLVSTVVSAASVSGLVSASAASGVAIAAAASV